jgi:hypothetical protein
LIGPIYNFIAFPKIFITLEFSYSEDAISPPLRTRTKEGLALGLHVAFQYRLIPDKIPLLYAMANLEYEETFVRIARDVI